ncbi:multidrug resistance fnx1 [Trichoderma arundinaceum]|uniref:Multidrug resistance fnx1 n=1 Tax=Trichoderma arundinaceum TaxID=490622 RepID=A0A395NFU3_TRIAR|nr:multidrug resistance fnx1 [Trichoderma arundinaceum]
MTPVPEKPKSREGEQPILLAELDNSKLGSTSSLQQEPSPPKKHYSTKFWLAFSGLCFTSLISALDSSILSTSLPTIIADLHGGRNFIWVVNVYFMTRQGYNSAAFQPLYGQLANLWGRRYVMILSTVIFLLGSGLCGGANSMDMLIGGRAVQGIGAGGINMLVDMIICDLVPMRDRGNFIGLLFLFVSLGTTSGPIIGGALTDHVSWRWIFYLNLPLGGAALALLLLFLQVKWKKELSMPDRLKRIDIVGNTLLVCATFSILWALTYGGTQYLWSDVQVVVPLVLGFVGLIIFVCWECTRFCKHPVVPLHHFKSRTASAAFCISFMSSLISFWFVYFYPVYFQSVLGNSPTKSGINLLPFQIIFPLFAAVGGGIVSKTGRYKPIHLICTAITTLSTGLCSILAKDTNKGAWIVFQILAGASMGCMVSTTLQAVQAGLPESEVAASTATWAFIRSLGTIWGVSVPSAVFNNRFDQLSSLFDASIRDEFTRGQAYEHATAQFVNSFDPSTRVVIIDAYTDALKRVWLVSIAFGAVAFLSVFFEKELTLRTELDSDFGLADGKKERVRITE